MKFLRVLFLLTLTFVFFSCKERDFTYDDEAAAASGELSQTEKDINGSEAAIQLAQLPEPDGTPILVGIDKGFWVEDPTDPTPFINIVHLFSNLYLRSDNVYGEWFYEDTAWIRVGYSDTNLVRLIWINSKSDTLRLTLYADSTDGMTSYIHVLRGRIILERNGVNLLSSVFSVNGRNIDVWYQIKDIATCFVNAVRSNGNITSPFIGTLRGGAIKGDGSAGDTVYVYAACNVDSTRNVQIKIPYGDIIFTIEATVSKIQISQSGPRYRDISGDFFANTLDIGDVTGRKYEYQDDAHKNYLRIILKSGRTLNLW
uniref:Lipoprotein n=1 Tax=candidate division WOR-3 bacterium TaxID=2052148 RepID=A0A7V4E415_UNCW3